MSQTLEKANWDKTLQWGHRYEAVDIAYENARCEYQCQLQWGHRYEAVDMSLGDAPLLR